MCADMVEVRWETERRPKQSWALLEDISPSGACLQLDAAVPLGTEVYWNAPRQAFSGIVRYCNYRKTGYFVGIEFSNACRWSKGAFRPQHLLDLKKLVVKTNE